MIFRAGRLSIPVRNGSLLRCVNITNLYCPSLMRDSLLLVPSP